MDDKALLRKDFDVGPYVVTAGSDEQPVIKLLPAKGFLTSMPIVVGYGRQARAGRGLCCHPTWLLVWPLARALAGRRRSSSFWACRSRIAAG